MRTILSVLLVCFLHSAFAGRSAKYYFSTNSGNDSRSPSQAQNPSTPWKTLNKLNSFFSNLQPGDAVFLKRGETFYGSITVSKSGTSGAPIIIGAYGSGNKPIITSLVTLSGWKANSSNKGVYECDANSALGSAVNIVLLNGKEKGMGRFPNIDEPNKGYLTIESHSGKDLIKDKQLKPSPNWKGAELVIKPCRWIIDRCLITSHSGTAIRFKGGRGIRDGYGYFIQNHIKTLDQIGEWYYNPSTKKISMFFGSNSPSSYKIQAGSINTLVYSRKQSNVVFDNLTFKGSNGYGINLIRGSNLTVRNCDVIFSGIDGVIVSSTTNFILENSSILNSHNNGIVVGSSNTHAIIRNNIIRNTFTIPGMGKSGNGQGVSVRISNGGLLEYNQIVNSGYVAIDMGGDYTVVKNNFIDSFCSVKDDGAGIYTSNGTNKNYKGRKIAGNIILNGIGAGEGTTSPNSSSADGIYMDDNANRFDITDNTVANCNRGIYLHNSRYIVVKNNTVYNNKNGQLYIKHDNLGADKVKEQTITNNIFFSKLATQKVSAINTIDDIKDIKSMGKFDNNHYARPIDDKATIFNALHIFSGREIRTNTNLEGWKLKSGHDKASKKSPQQIPPFKVRNLTGSNKFKYGDFKSSSDVRGFGNKCKLSWQKSGLLDEGYLKVTPSEIGSAFVISVGAVSSSKKYILRYSIRGTANSSIGAYLRNSAYKRLTSSQLQPITTSRTEVEMVFSPKKNENRASLIIYPDGKNTYYIDNIKLYEGDAEVTNPDDYIRFVFNHSQANKTVRLDGNYVDARNNKFSNSITLNPYSAAVLIKSDEPSDKKSGPTVSIKNPINKARFTGPATIKMEAKAEDKDGTISKVQFYNGSKLLQTVYSAPYTYTWSNVSAGNHVLTAKATDNDGQVATSSEISVAVVAKKSAAPTVKITSPANNASYLNLPTIQIGADATDADGTISKVEFYIGSTLLATKYSTPYTFIWNNARAGKYTITAKATDNDGLSTKSAGVSVSVAAKSNQPPNVNMIDPDNNSGFAGPATINMSANATDKDGTISKVEFYNGKKLLHTEYTNPYRYTWNNVRQGNYTITAKATDNDGNVTTSKGVSISVRPNQAPTVSITNPDNNKNFKGPATIDLVASAKDRDGKISKVEFYNGSTLLDIEYWYPYTYTWKDVRAGTYRIKAIATDNNGLSSTSAIVKVTVAAPNKSVSNRPSSAITDKETTGESDVSLSHENLKLSPNPTRNTLYISTNGLPQNKELSIFIISVSGTVIKTVKSNSSSQVVQMDVSSLNNGVYVIKVICGDKILSQQFVKL